MANEGDFFAMEEREWCGEWEGVKEPEHPEFGPSVVNELAPLRQELDSERLQRVKVERERDAIWAANRLIMQALLGEGTVVTGTVEDNKEWAIREASMLRQGAQAAERERDAAVATVAQVEAQLATCQHALASAESEWAGWKKRAEALNEDRWCCHGEDKIVLRERNEALARVPPPEVREAMQAIISVARYSMRQDIDSVEIVSKWLEATK
jgi:chromosome segregation ATPase